MTRSRAPVLLVLAALAVLGVLRVPCLFGSSLATLASRAEAPPPCHGAPAAPAPASQDEAPPSSCTQCAALHSLVGPASSVAAPGAEPLALPSDSPAEPSRSLRLGAPALASAAGRAPDPRRASTVLLL